MPVVPLTQTYIDNELACPADRKRVELCDANMPGLYAEVRSVNPANLRIPAKPARYSGPCRATIPGHAGRGVTRSRDYR